MEMAKVVTVEELSDYLNVPVSTLFKLILEKRLPAVRMGDSWQFDWEDVRDLVDKMKERERRREETLWEIGEGMHHGK
jgi:excisionase family DNA binding protein